MVRQIIGTDTKLTVNLDPDAGRIRADDGQLGQIVINLVLNARDAMPNGGTLTIETGNVSLDEFSPARRADVEAEPYVFLAVADTGNGMDHATRDHIFEPFFTTKDAGKGTGLGLATADGIMHRAGGHIVVASELGHGSTFTLNFPNVGVSGLGPVPRAQSLEASG
jgi:signal transduction histidine kinase